MNDDAGRERQGLQDGEKIRQLRKYAGYSTATAFAHRVGIKPQSLINIERGNRPASLATLTRIAQALDKKVDDLLKEAALNELGPALTTPGRAGYAQNE